MGRDSWDGRSRMCCFLRQMVISSVTWDGRRACSFSSRDLILHLTVPDMRRCLGFSLPCRALEVQSAGVGAAECQILPEALTQAGGFHAGSCVHSVPKEAVTRHFVPHNSSYTGS